MTRRRERVMDPPAQRRMGTPFLDEVAPSDPTPPKDAAPEVSRTIIMPAVRTSAPIADLLTDVRSLVKQGLDALKQQTTFTPNDAKTLEALARAAKVAQDMERAVNEDLGAKLNKLSDAQLQEVADELGIDVATLRGRKEE